MLYHDMERDLSLLLLLLLLLLLPMIYLSFNGEWWDRGVKINLTAINTNYNI